MAKDPAPINYETVHDTICRLGNARLDRIAKKCSMSRSTVSRAIWRKQVNQAVVEIGEAA